MERKNTIVNAAYFMDRFPDEESAMEYLNEMKWGGQPRCPKCGAQAREARYKGSKGFYLCRGGKCRRLFSAKSESIFAKTRVPLHKSFLAAYRIMRPEGIGTFELADELGIDQGSAWFLAMRICAAMGRGKDGIVLNGIVECDEALFGGSDSKRLPADKFRGGVHAGKQGAFCMVERGVAGRAITMALPDKPVKIFKGRMLTMPDMSRKVLRRMIRERVNPCSIICTDSNPSYGDLAGDGLARLHFTVDHGRHEYVAYPNHPEIKKAHTNTVESRWSTLKSSLGWFQGRYTGRLQPYLDAADFRWNETRVFEKDRNGELVFKRRAPTLEAFEKFIKLCLGEWLPLNELMK
jgi:transposase-like protein